ncbi:hypothetical protein QUA81_21535 [Microcoleus sp. F6_B4]|jgi:hypothetical protein
MLVSQPSWSFPKEDEYAELIEEQLQVIEQEEDGERAVARLRKLLFDN